MKAVLPISRAFIRTNPAARPRRSQRLFLARACASIAAAWLMSSGVASGQVLTVTAPAGPISLGSAPAGGTITGAFGTIAVSDTRGLVPGEWGLSPTGTAATNGLASIPASAMRLDYVSDSYVVNCPGGSAGSIVGWVHLNEGRTMWSLTCWSATHSASISTTVRVDVPATATAGTYSFTLTNSLDGGAGGGGGSASTIVRFTVLPQAGPAFTVNTLADDAGDGACSGGHCTLREAIDAANAQAGANTIDFSVSGTITLGSALPNITDAAELTINGAGQTVTVSGNDAVRIAVVDGGASLRLQNLTLTRGRATGAIGSALINFGTLTIDRASVTDNNALCDAGGSNGIGAIYNAATLTIHDTALSNNYSCGGGGAIYSEGTVTISDSTLSGNSVSVGGRSVAAGGALNLTIGSTTVLTNVTVSGNAAWNGGGLYVNNATATLTNCTVSGNTAGALAGGVHLSASAVTLTNTIVAGNTAGSSDPDIVNPVTSGGHNLVGVAAAGIVNGVNGDIAGTAAAPVSAYVAGLGSYGGSIQTVALLPGSPAIDAGDDAVCSAAVGAPTYGAGGVDGRGVARAGLGTHCDIGAFESRGFALGSLTGTPQSTLLGTAFASALGTTITPNSAGEPVAGGVVTFTAPGAGASATLGSSTMTIPAGGAVTTTATANGIAGAYQVTASASGVATPAAFNLTNLKFDQAITFAALADKTYGTADFTVSATASSGLTVTFSVGAGDECTMAAATTVHITGSGSCTVTASQGGNATFNAAISVARTFTIVITAQTITVGTHAPASATYGATFTVAATASSGLTVSYSSGSPSVCTNSGGAFTMVASAGTCVVQYDQAGNGNYGAASRVTESVAVGKASQAITVGTHAPASAAYGTAFTVAATASSGLAVSYSSGSTGVCTNSGLRFTMVAGTGTCVVQYDQAGDGNYAAASRVSESVTAGKASQTITVGTHAPASAAYGATFTVAATASSGLTVSYGSGSTSVCTNSGPTFTMIAGAGGCVVQYDQAGDGNYTPASRVTESVAVGKATATLTLGALTFAWDGTAKPVAVTTDPSGLAVTVTYTGSGGTTYGPTTSAPADPGQYAVVASLDVNTRFTAADATGTLTITAGAVGEITALSPASLRPGHAAFTLTVRGAGFVNGATVRVNGSNRTTGYVSATVLRAEIRASDVAAAGSIPVTVRNAGAVESTASVNLAVGDPDRDLNVDGAADLVHHDVEAGELAFWVMAGTTPGSILRVEAAFDRTWRVAGTGDFDRDGDADLLWYNVATGEIGVWYLHGTTRAASARITGMRDPEWTVGAIGDLNADGKPDLVWRNRTTGETRVWYMSGTARVGEAQLTGVPDAAWTLAAADHFDDDGQPDLVWYNRSTGQSMVWLMDGAVVAGTVALDAAPGAGWMIVATGDLNHDGEADLIWRDTATGAQVVWFMNGTTRTGTASLPAVPVLTSGRPGGAVVGRAVPRPSVPSVDPFGAATSTSSSTSR